MASSDGSSSDSSTSSSSRNVVAPPRAVAKRKASTSSEESGSSSGSDHQKTAVKSSAPAQNVGWTGYQEESDDDSVSIQGESSVSATPKAAPSKPSVPQTGLRTGCREESDDESVSMQGESSVSASPKAAPGKPSGLQTVQLGPGPMTGCREESDDESISMQEELSVSASPKASPSKPSGTQVINTGSNLLDTLPMESPISRASPSPPSSPGATRWRQNQQGIWAKMDDQSTRFMEQSSVTGTAIESLILDPPPSCRENLGGITWIYDEAGNRYSEEQDSQRKIFCSGETVQHNEASDLGDKPHHSAAATIGGGPCEGSAREVDDLKEKRDTEHESQLRAQKEAKAAENWLHISQTIVKRKEEVDRQKLKEERSRLQDEEMERLGKELQRRLEEEDAQRREVEARRREEETRRRGMDARRKEEEIKKRQADAMETVFWNALAPDEATKLRGMLQAVSLYQQQMQQNDRELAELQERTKSRDKAYQGLKLRVQQASHDTDMAREQEKRARDELGRWSRKREQYESSGQDIEALRGKHQFLQADRRRLSEQRIPLQREVTAVQEKITQSDEMSSTLASRLVALKSKCQQTVASTKAEHVEELAQLRAQQTEELTRLEVDIQNSLGSIRVDHAQEASKLRVALDEATRRKEKHRQERDATADQLLDGQREGARLQRLSSDARQEVLELCAQLKVSGMQHNQKMIEMPLSRSRSMTQMGRSAPPSQMGRSAPPSPGVSHMLDASISSNGGSKMQIESDLQMFRKRCKQLERECEKTHSLLQKKQEQCDRWRKKSFESGPKTVTTKPTGPFTLGPSEKDVSGLILLSPNGTRTL